MSGGTREVQATFWLLDAPASLLLQSEGQPDGVGLGTFGANGAPSVYRKPVAANRSVPWSWPCGWYLLLQPNHMIS